MKFVLLFSSLLALSFSIAPPGALAHGGHGDEFQATGGVNRVEINAETDPLLGIQVAPIEPAADGSAAVLIPVTALVDDNGRQLVFVQYESFYDPVDVVTGPTQGELIEITAGLSVGEQLVIQGSLSLYAESRKTQAATGLETDGSSPTAIAQTVETLDTSEPPVAQVSADQSGGLPLKALATGGVIFVGSAIALLVSSRNKKKELL